MSRRHIPESPKQVLRRARAIIRHMRDFAADCDAYFRGSALADLDAAGAVQALGLVFGLGAERFALGIDNFVAENAEVFGVKPSSHAPARRECDSCGDGASPASETAEKSKGDEGAFARPWWTPSPAPDRQGDT